MRFRFRNGQARMCHVRVRVLWDWVRAGWPRRRSAEPCIIQSSDAEHSCVSARARVLLTAPPPLRSASRHVNRLQDPGIPSRTGWRASCRCHCRCQASVAVNVYMCRRPCMMGMSCCFRCRCAQFCHAGQMLLQSSLGALPRMRCVLML